MAKEYVDLNNRHQKEFDDFSSQYMFYAFSDKQFKEGCEKLNIDPKKDKLLSIEGGGFILAENEAKLDTLMERIATEMSDAIKADKTGTGFILDMFCYELSNHEYNVTHEIDDTLDALNLTVDDINKSPNLLNGLQKAMKKCK